jgi:hypothetical protein
MLSIKEDEAIKSYVAGHFNTDVIGDTEAVVNRCVIAWMTMSDAADNYVLFQDHSSMKIGILTENPISIKPGSALQPALVIDSKRYLDLADLKKDPQLRVHINEPIYDERHLGMAHPTIGLDWLPEGKGSLNIVVGKPAIEEWIANNGLTMPNRFWTLFD